MWFVADIEIKREPADPPPTPPPRVIGVLLPIKKEETDTDSDNPHDEEPQPHHEAAGKQWHDNVLVIFLQFVRAGTQR